MPQVNMHEAKTGLSRLVEALVSGEESDIVIARNGKPVVRMTAITAERPKRRLGQFAGRATFDFEAFQALDAEIWKGIEGEYGIDPPAADQ